MLKSFTFLILFIICLFLIFQKAIEAKAIILNQKEDDIKFNELRAEDLSKMEHLKLLILNHKNFSGKPSCLSNSLRYLLWNGYPFISLPSNFQPYHLVELHLPDSSIEQLWTDIQVHFLVLFSSPYPQRNN